MEFTRVVPWFKKGHSTVSGTQCIDSTWGALDNFIPLHVNTKQDHKVNPRLSTYLWAGLFRLNNRDSDGLTMVGRAFARRVASRTIALAAGKK